MVRSGLEASPKVIQCLIGQVNPVRTLRSHPMKYLGSVHGCIVSVGDVKASLIRVVSHGAVKDGC